MSGYEYVDEASIDSDLLCSICREPCREPQCTSCEHLFCLPCITRWQRGALTSCPNCRRRLNRTDLRPASVLIDQLLNKLRVKCQQCGRTDLFRATIDEHLRSDCSKSIVSCTTATDKCPWTGQREQREEHSAHCLCTSFPSTVDQFTTKFARLEAQRERNERSLRSMLEEVKESISMTKEMRTIDLSTAKSKLDECQQETRSTGELLNVLEAQVGEIKVECHLHRQAIDDLDAPFGKNEIQIEQLTKNLQLMKELLVSNGNSQLEKDLLEQKDSRSIDLSRRHLTDQDMLIIVQHLSSNEHCQALDLRENLISEDGIILFASLLAQPNTINRLYLGHNCLRDAGVSRLAETLSTPHCHLIELQLDANDITDQGARFLASMLASNRTLEHLSLNGNRLSEKGMTSLADVLIDQNKTLQEFHLSDNQLTSELPVNTFVRMIQCNVSLRRFTLKKSNLSDENKIKLQQVAKYKTHFSLEV